jgi:hypothetical protein
VNGRAGNFGWPTVVWSRVSTEAEDTIAEVLRLQKRNEITLGRLTTIISPIGSHAADVGRSGKWAAIELEVPPQLGCQRLQRASGECDGRAVERRWWQSNLGAKAGRAVRGSTVKVARV